MLFERGPRRYVHVSTPRRRRATPPWNIRERPRRRRDPRNTNEAPRSWLRRDRPAESPARGRGVAATVPRTFQLLVAASPRPSLGRLAARRLQEDAAAMSRNGRPQVLRAGPAEDLAEARRRLLRFRKRVGQSFNGRAPRGTQTLFVVPCRADVFLNVLISRFARRRSREFCTTSTRASAWRS